jgi:alkylation response protein AidB-like acyl-CoA dehydrogenase
VDAGFSSARAGPAGEWLARARELVPRLDAAGAQIDAGRELPAPILEALHVARLFRVTLPRELDGAELALAELAELAETVATGDASVAWCLGQSWGCALSAAYLDPDAAQRVFGPRDAVLAWGAGAQGRALAADGGYRISGRWGFASGGWHATWIGAHCKVYEADGTPRLDAAGRHVSRTALLPRDAVSLGDDWHVVGLRGTRSEGYTVEDRFVEAALTLDRETRGECRLDRGLYRFSTTQVYASAFSGVALGIARACLDRLLQLARHKTPRGAGAMRDSAVVQSRLAELEATLGSARAYQRQALERAWDAAERTGATAPADRAAIRLATTYAVGQATDVVEQVYRLAGATAIFDSQPFERRFRDAHAVSQQVQGRFTHYETVGRLMLGLEVDETFL